METGRVSHLPPSERLEPSRGSARREQGSGGRRRRRQPRQPEEEPLSPSLRARLPQTGGDEPDAEVRPANAQTPDAGAEPDTHPFGGRRDAADEGQRGRRIDIRV